MPICVECYSGYRGEQEPVAFWLGERRCAVIAIDDRWIAPDHRGFRVRTDDGIVHVLRYDTTCDVWEVAEGGVRGGGGLSLRVRCADPRPGRRPPRVWCPTRT